MFAEDKTYKFIYHQHSRFCRVDVLEILPHLPCLTASDQDRLRAAYNRLGNRDTLWDLFNTLQRRTGWVNYFVEALRVCELDDLADLVEREYRSHLPRTLNHPRATREVPAPATPAADHDGSKQQLSYPLPVQDTQQPKSPGQSPEQAPQKPSSEPVLRTSPVPLEPSCDRAAINPQVTTRPQDVRPDSILTGGTVSSPMPPQGPVSPSVSFQPLARSRASPGPAVSISSTGTSCSSGQDGGAQDEATVCPSDTVPAGSGTTIPASSRVPSNLMSVSTVPSGAPASPAPASMVSSKSPANPKILGATPSDVLPSLAPSQLPIISPTNAASVLPKVPASPLPTSRSSNRAQETPMAPAPRDTPGDSLLSGPELSKPNVLLSQPDSQPYSGCSADLDISRSSSLAPGASHGPEENEYVSVGTFGVHVVEEPSANLLTGNPGPSVSPYLQEKEEEDEEEIQSNWVAPWAPRFGAAIATALVATVLAMLYRRRALQ